MYSLGTKGRGPRSKNRSNGNPDFLHSAFPVALPERARRKGWLRDRATARELVFFPLRSSVCFWWGAESVGGGGGESGGGHEGRHNPPPSDGLIKWLQRLQKSRCASVPGSSTWPRQVPIGREGCLLRRCACSCSGIYPTLSENLCALSARFVSTTILGQTSSTGLPYRNNFAQRRNNRCA